MHDWWVRRALVGIVMSSALLGACDWSDALRSDPNAWSPAQGPRPSTETPPAEGGQTGAEQPSGCDAEPPFDPSLRLSAADTLSHRAGEACLEGCHEAGGSAQLVLAAAGTAYRRQGERALAEAGRVIQGVGGSELSIDACGNFYAVEGALTASVARTQPWVKEPTFRRMEKPLLRVSRPGDCNQSGCHDFSSRLSTGIYF